MSTKTKPRAAPTPAQPATSLVYLYGVLESGSPAHQLLVDRRVPGLDPAEPLFALETGGLVAAVSYVPAGAFQEQPLNALVADLDRLAPYAVRHQAAIAALAREAPSLVPMGFGVVYRDRDRVTAVLRERAAGLRDLLDQVRERDEWGLRITLDPRQLQSAATAESEAVQRLDAEIRSASPGRAYLRAKQRDRLVQTEADRLARDILAEIYARLAAASAAARQDALPPEPTAGVRLALKAAFLVDRGQVERFRAVGAELSRDNASRGFGLEFSGPWAPYSFVSNRPS